MFKDKYIFTEPWSQCWTNLEILRPLWTTETAVGSRVQAKSWRLCGHVVPTRANERGVIRRPGGLAWSRPLGKRKCHRNKGETKMGTPSWEIGCYFYYCTLSCTKQVCVRQPHQNTRFEKRTCAICWCSNAHLRTRALDTMYTLHAPQLFIVTVGSNLTEVAF